MRTSFLHTCVAAIALTGAGWAHPAMAQEAPAGSGGSQASSGNAQAGSNDTAEIVVTAQKRKEKLQSIPVAAAVLTADKIEQAHVLDLSDINRVVPSVEIKGSATTKSQLSALPEPVRKTVQKQVGNAEIAGINKKDDNGRVIYEIEFKDSGKNPTIKVAADGTIVEGLQK